MSQFISRRVLIKSGLLAGAMVPAIGLLANTARAQSVMLDVNDPAAKGLGYVVASTNPAQTCANCAQYKGKPGDSKGGCNLFPGKDVAAGGYCKAWAKKPQ